MIPLETLRTLAQENDYGFNHYVSPLGEPTRLVLVGEKHVSSLHYNFQSDLIRLLKPQVVMHEFYDPSDTKPASGSIAIALRWINRWKDEFGIELKPCDWPNEKNLQFQRFYYELLQRSCEFHDERVLDSIIVDDCAIREIIMGKLIRAELARTDKALIAIVGGYHVRPESRIHQELRCKRTIELGTRDPIGYVTINQDRGLAQVLQQAAKFFE